MAPPPPKSQQQLSNMDHMVELNRELGINMKEIYHLTRELLEKQESKLEYMKKQKFKTEGTEELIKGLEEILVVSSIKVMTKEDREKAIRDKSLEKVRKFEV